MDQILWLHFQVLSTTNTKPNTNEYMSVEARFENSISVSASLQKFSFGSFGKSFSFGFNSFQEF